VLKSIVTREMTKASATGEWEHVIMSYVKRLIPESIKTKWHQYKESVKQAERQMTGKRDVTDHVEIAGWGVEEARERNKKDASKYSFSYVVSFLEQRIQLKRIIGLATQLALAYAIHKSFIFIRVPLAAAITPKVVKVLRGWGWDIGRRTTKEAKAIKRSLAAKPATK